MSNCVDVFVIGGGPAGLAAAIAARQRGYSVVVADGAEPPIDKACGEGLMPDSVRVLGKLGLDLPKNDGFDFRGIRFVDHDFVAQAEFPDGPGIGVRREVLHQKMVNRAEALGVTLLWGTPVTGISSSGVLAGGKAIGAHWIIGADGIRSRVRGWIGLEDAHARMRYAFRRHYRMRAWSDYTEVHWANHAQAYVTPVGSEDLCVVLISADAGERFASLAEKFPQLAERLGSAPLIGSERGAVTLSQSLRRVYSGRVALIGDASGTVDAITGEGLSLSFHQALALADAMEGGNLALYQKAHRRIARRPTLMGRLLLSLSSSSKVRHRVMRELSAHPNLFARLLAIHVGETSPSHLAATGALLSWHFATA